MRERLKFLPTIYFVANLFRKFSSVTYWFSNWKYLFYFTEIFIILKSQKWDSFVTLCHAEMRVFLSKLNFYHSNVLCRRFTVITRVVICFFTKLKVALVHFYNGQCVYTNLIRNANLKGIKNECEDFWHFFLSW